MQATGKKSMYPSRSRATGVWFALLSVLAICLCATAAAAQSAPPVVVSQYKLVADFSGGGFTAGGGALTGGSFAVTPAGDVVVGTLYGGKPDLVNMDSGAVSTPFPGSNSIGATTDAAGNLYYHLNFYYGGSGIERIPYVNGAYVTTGGGGACVGGDVAPCTITPAVNPGPYKDLAFDSEGDLFLVGVNSSSGAGATVIYEIKAANLYATANPALTTIYSDANAVGSIAIDPWGNLYFTDATYTDQGNQIASGSTFNVLTYNGTSYAATPVQLASFTPKSGNYSDTLDAIAIDSNGTVYFGNQSDGIFAFPTTSSTSVTSTYVNNQVYPVSSKGGYAIAFDHKGNLDMIAYDNANGVSAVWKTRINNVVVPAAGTTQTDVFVNDGSTTVTGVAKENGAATTEFAVAPGTGAAPANSTGSTISILPIANSRDFTGPFTFTQAAVGERNAAITFTTANSNSLTVAVTGTGIGAAVALDPGFATAYAAGFTNPQSISVDGAGDLFVTDSGKLYEIAGGSAANTAPSQPVTSGLGSDPTATVFDASGNLYVADATNNEIYEVANGASTATTLVSDTVTFGGTALNGPAGLAVGPDGTLYIADTGNNRIVSYNHSSGFKGVPASGLDTPTGIAVDSAGTLYIANTGSSNPGVVVYTGGSAPAPYLPTGVTVPGGVAVDASGSLLISDTATGAIVRVPFETSGGTGALNPADALTIEQNPTSAYGIALDGWGNLYTTDASGKAVYAIVRTAASINFGTVNGGDTVSAIIYVENAGNQALAAPTIGTEPDVPFTLAAGGALPCGTAPIATGKSCDLSAGFTAPASGTLTSSASLSFTNAQLATASVTMTGIGEVASGTTEQQIHFDTPFGSQTTSVTYNTTPYILYATASSGLPVSFSVTGPGAITGTAKASTLTVTGCGGQVPAVQGCATAPLVVTASQTGDNTYKAATPVSWTVTVNPLGAVATPTLSLPANTYTFAPQTVTISDTTPGAVIYYTVTSGATGTTPTTSSSVYGGPITITDTETIETLAVAAGYSNSTVASSTYTISVQPAAFTVAFNASSLTIPSQQAGAINVIVTPTNGFNSTVTLNVSGLPANATSSFTPPTLVLSGGHSGTSVLTISLSPSAALHQNSNPLFPAATFAFALCFFGWKKRRGMLQLLLLLAVGVAALSLFTGCSSTVQPTSSTITVTATSGSLVESSTFSFTVTPN